MYSTMVRVSLIILLSFLASCGQPPQEQSSTTPPTPSSAPASSADSPKPAGASSNLFFAGRWASEAANCRELSWTISEHGLQTPGEVNCRFHRVTPTPRGAEVEATCTAEGPPQEWKLQFAYAESARALLIENAPFADIGLIRCDDSAPSDSTSSSAHAGGDDPVAKSARGAANVVNKYYELLNAGRSDEASRLWTPGDQASGLQSSQQSAADYAKHEVQIGEPGRIEGAAGSLYMSIPVQIRATRKSGEAAPLTGEVTLRRSNNVPGATPEQLSWRIFRIELQPAASAE